MFAVSAEQTSGAERQLDQGLESIELCTALRESLTARYAGRDHPAAPGEKTALTAKLSGCSLPETAPPRHSFTGAGRYSVCSANAIN
jgi:hypothetical protein